MTGFKKKVSPASPTRSSGRGPNAKKDNKKDPVGTFLSFKSSRVSSLKRQSSAGTRFQTTCITKHFELNHQVYEGFQVQYYNLSSVVDTNNESKNDDTAQSNFEFIANVFCLGYNIIETALLDLPTHGYFYSNGDPKIVMLRARSSQVALEVTRLLQRILKLMDTMNASFCSQDLNPARDYYESDILWLLEHNREECKNRLVILKYLAKEQCENLESYENKRLSVAGKWKRHQPEHRAPVVVGNHRSFKTKKNPVNSSSDEPMSALDCETVNETFLSCSRILCPGSLPDPPGAQKVVVVEPEHSDDSRQQPSLSQKSLVDLDKDSEDEEEGEYDDNDDDDDDDGSDHAVFANTGIPASGGWIQTKKTDDAVFEKTMIPKTPSGMMVQTSERQMPSPDRSTSNSSRRQRKMPNSSKKKQQKQKNNSDSKKGNRYTSRLFGKKSNSVLDERQQQKKLEEAQVEEALYQSELEAAKAASMRDDDDLEAAKAASMREEDLYEQYSSYDDDRDASSAIISPDVIDYDLQEALYQSELEAARMESFEALSQEEEKRDDSGHEGRREVLVPKIIEPVIVRGTPVPRAPPGAIQRCRNDPYDSLQVLKACCRKDFERLREQNKVVVARIPTYQGRIKDSTNGCTVIAPLLCAHYFQTNPTEDSQITRLSDDRITSIIDVQCPALLPDIRKSLGVSKNAFLIPHDAHEHLIDRKHMDRDQFVTVCGGNILEEGHLGALIKELSQSLPDGKKLGATFFFHQHVIAILQLRNSNSRGESISFDIIDSLPNKATLPLPPPSPVSEKVTEKLLPPPPNCARIFCKDAIALKATLKWYACSVFNPENERYIDAYHWDEKLTDFDPRVFQAFVW
eukprot:CAMPEP_0116139308 /NCGR_PEP_ID=MMETSP0329-20121206/13245_1 /TAXON_ID=697910 /ORGANISM="Pseudo-nitzschia arenysensis, Strain B593" /LENGTH=858 /DNA_ID=CAMNT_0003634347 /DNA_START=302 /DNA_END=2875 /DNA_ORIENTATION=-